MNLTEKYALEVAHDMFKHEKIVISKSKLCNDLFRCRWGEEEILAIIIAVKECKDNIEVIE